MIEAPRLFTSHWRSPLLADVEAQAVSISRGQPRWRLPFSYRRMRELAPGDAAWRHDDTEAFERAYIDQLAELGASRILAGFEQIGSRIPLILLCWERPGEFCHRRVLADYLRTQTGIEVPELQPGDLPRRTDAAEPKLF